MLAVRQFLNISASLNPFNLIPQAEPTATQPLFPTIGSTGSLLPIVSTPVAPLPSSVYNGISPSRASGLPSLPGTRTLSFDRQTATTSVTGGFTGVFGGPSSMASGSSFKQSVKPTGITISVKPGPSSTRLISFSQSDLARASARTSAGPSSTKSVERITTLTSSTTISPSKSTTSHSTTSSSSSSSRTTSDSSITSVPAARATSTSPDMSTKQKATLSSGAIAGITFASAASVAILAFLLFFCLRRRRTQKPPSIYPEEAYLYDPPITPPSNMPEAIRSAQPWMMSNTAYYPTTQLPSVIPNSPPMNPNSPPMRAVTPEGYERVGLLGTPEGEQDLGMLGSWPLRGRNSSSYRPLGTGRGYRLPPLHEDLQESLDTDDFHQSIQNDPRNPFHDRHVI